MPIAEKIPSSPDQGSACVGKRCVLCTVACRDRSGPVQHVTQHVTQLVTHTQMASPQVLMDHAYITTAHLTDSQQQAVMSAVCLMHDLHYGFCAQDFMSVMLPSCAHCAVMQALTCKVPCLCSMLFLC